MTSVVRKISIDAPPILILPRPIIPGSDDGVFRSMRLVDPFVDPPNTFRARTIEDTFFIVPGRGLFDRFEFDVGLEPDIGPFIFSIQNKTVNTVLRVNLTLPSYLRSNLGTVFDVPFIGDTSTPPIKLSRLTVFGGAPPPLDFVGAGKGLINVSLTFSEAQAKTFNPGKIIDDLIFDIFHRDELTGPIFVSTTIREPKDLNPEVRREAELSGITALQVSVPLDSGDLDAQIEISSPVTASVEEVSFAPPPPSPHWVDGTDGRLKVGSPPAGWITEADGRSYPPLDQPEPEVVESVEVDGIDTGSLSPIEQLFVETNRTTAPSFGSETSRKGFVIDVIPLLDGVQINRIVRQVPQLLVADSVPSDTRFKIVNTSDTFPDGNPVPIPEIDSRIREYFDQVNFHVGVIKQDEPVPFSFDTATQSAINNAIRRLLDTGDPVVVKGDVSEAQQQNLRIIVTSAAILKQLITTGGISPLTDLSTQIIRRLI